MPKSIKMIASIMQPTFLPWIGYFDLVDQSDIFVFLDNVQFKKRSWQQRNKVRTPSGLEWLTVPTLVSGRFEQTISEVEIKTDAFPEKQIKTLQHHYSKTPYFAAYWPELEAILQGTKQDKSLARLNIDIIRWLAGQFEIVSKFVLASEIHTESQRSERLVGILEYIKAETYLSPCGSFEYLYQDRDVFARAGIPIIFQNFVHPVYKQRYSPFEIGASAIDILFNEGGKGAACLMRSGRKPSEHFEDVIKINKDVVYANK
jgi:hypothetical protein